MRDTNVPFHNDTVGYVIWVTTVTQITMVSLLQTANEVNQSFMWIAYNMSEFKAESFCW